MLLYKACYYTTPITKFVATQHPLQSPLLYGTILQARRNTWRYLSKPRPAPSNILQDPKIFLKVQILLFAISY